MPSIKMSLWDINKNIEFPEYFDLFPSLVIGFILILLNKLFQALIGDFFKYRLSKKFYEAEESEYLVNFYKNKVASNCFKCAFFTVSTILGFLIFKDCDFFPWQMLGSGDYGKFMQQGASGIFSFKKPALLYFYYNLNLGYAHLDIYMLFTNPLAADFLIMLLHHIATVSLVVFFICV